MRISSLTLEQRRKLKELAEEFCENYPTVIGKAIDELYSTVKPEKEW